MKKYPKTVKFLEQMVFFELFQKFITDSSKGYRVQKSGQRIKPQTIENYTYTLKLVQQFCEEVGFEIKIKNPFKKDLYVNFLDATATKCIQN